MNTRRCLIFLTSSSGMTYMQRPMMKLEQVEGSRSDNGSRSQVTSFESLGPDFNNRQHDLWSRGPKGHECKIGNSFIPDFDNDDLGLASPWVLYRDLFLLSSDHLNRLHELVRDNGNTNEEPQHKNSVQKSTSESVTNTHLISSGP